MASSASLEVSSQMSVEFRSASTAIRTTDDAIVATWSTITPMKIAPGLSPERTPSGWIGGGPCEISLKGAPGTRPYGLGAQPQPTALTASAGRMRPPPESYQNQLEPAVGWQLQRLVRRRLRGSRYPSDVEESIVTRRLRLRTMGPVLLRASLGGNRRRAKDVDRLDLGDGVPEFRKPGCRDPMRHVPRQVSRSTTRPAKLSDHPGAWVVTTHSRTSNGA